MWSRRGDERSGLGNLALRAMYRPQLSELQLDALLRYKNKGVDLSITYRYILSALYDSLIAYVPLQAAPNLITMIGFMLAAGGHLCVLLHSPTLSERVPGWASAAAGVGLLLYMTLDNLDGRQARRTNSSSPLGHLFDHGCDALNVTLSAMALCASLQLGPRGALLLVLISQATLLAAGLEEYATGAMTLRVLNGANEGILALVFVQLSIAWRGAAAFHDTLPAPLPAWTPAQLAAGLQVAAAVCTILAGVHTCLHTCRMSPTSIARALAAPCAYFVAYGAWSCCASFKRDARVALWTSALFIFDVVSRTIVAHLTADHRLFPVMPRTLGCVLVPALLAAAENFHVGGAFVSAAASIAPAIALVVCAVLAMWRATCIVHQLCGFLGVHCFRLRARARDVRGRSVPAGGAHASK